MCHVIVHAIILMMKLSNSCSMKISCNRFYIDIQTIPWEQIFQPKVEAIVFKLQTKIYQAPRFNNMNKMRALQSKLIVI
jgi:hypothetical protein